MPWTSITSVTASLSGTYSKLPRPITEIPTELDTLYIARSRVIEKFLYIF